MNLGGFLKGVLTFLEKLEAVLAAFGIHTEAPAEATSISCPYSHTGLAADVTYKAGAAPPLEDVQKVAAELGLQVNRLDDHDHLSPAGTSA